MDRSNYLALENQANLHAYYPRPPPRPFGLALGALVTVKLVSLRRGGNAPPPSPLVNKFLKFFFFLESVAFGNKLSLTGYNSQQACVVAARQWKPTGRRGAGRAPYYQGMLDRFHFSFFKTILGLKRDRWIEKAPPPLFFPVWSDHPLIVNDNPLLTIVNGDPALTTTFH